MVPFSPEHPVLQNCGNASCLKIFLTLKPGIFWLLGSTTLRAIFAMSKHRVLLEQVSCTQLQMHNLPKLTTLSSGSVMSMTKLHTQITCESYSLQFLHFNQQHILNNMWLRNSSVVHEFCVLQSKSAACRAVAASAYDGRASCTGRTIDHRPSWSSSPCSAWWARPCPWRFAPEFESGLTGTRWPGHCRR